MIVKQERTEITISKSGKPLKPRAQYEQQTMRQLQHYYRFRTKTTTATGALNIFHSQICALDTANVKAHVLLKV